MARAKPESTNYVVHEYGVKVTFRAEPAIKPEGRFIKPRNMVVHSGGLGGRSLRAFADSFPECVNRRKIVSSVVEMIIANSKLGLEHMKATADYVRNDVILGYQPEQAPQ